MKNNYILSVNGYSPFHNDNAYYLEDGKVKVLRNHPNVRSYNLFNSTSSGDSFEYDIIEFSSTEKVFQAHEKIDTTGNRVDIFSNFVINEEDKDTIEKNFNHKIQSSFVYHDLKTSDTVEGLKDIINETDFAKSVFDSEEFEKIKEYFDTIPF